MFRQTVRQLNFNTQRKNVQRKILEGLGLIFQEFYVELNCVKLNSQTLRAVQRDDYTSGRGT
jgi:hypothetical protein